MFTNALFAVMDFAPTTSTEGIVTTGWLGTLLAMFAAFMVVAIIIGIALYVYNSVIWYTIAKKLKHKYPWLAWIPFANIAMILQLGDFRWALIFLLLIPLLGWLAVVVLLFIATWRVFEKRKYPGWLALIPLAIAIPFLGFVVAIGYLVLIGFVAWKDK